MDFQLLFKLRNKKLKCFIEKILFKLSSAGNLWVSANSKDGVSGHRFHPLFSYPSSVQRVEFKTCEPIRSEPEPCLKYSLLKTAGVIFVLFIFIFL